jgi:hypothetical protein
VGGSLEEVENLGMVNPTLNMMIKNQKLYIFNLVNINLIARLLRFKLFKDMLT